MIARQEVGMHQDQMMSPEDRAQLIRLIELWDAKPKNEFSFDPKDIRSIFLSGQQPPSRIAGHLPAPDSAPQPAVDEALVQRLLELQYVYLTPDEMKQVHPEEKVGGSHGDIVYLSTDVPEEYQPFVLFNLLVFRRLHSEHSKQMMALCGLDDRQGDRAVERHWTANMLDLAVAEATFGSNSEEFADFLRWRKEVEQTNFFQIPEFDAFVKKRMGDQNRRRLVHPEKRGRWNKQSWAVASLARDERFRGVVKMMGASRVDILAQGLLPDERFRANDMLRLIETIKKSDDHMIDVSSDEGLDRQAHLLTAQEADSGAVLERTGRGNAVYKVLRNASQTLDALYDRIAYFSKVRLESEGITTEMIAAMQRPAPILVVQNVQVNLNTNNPAILEQGIENMDEKIREINEMIQRIEAIEERMARLATSGNATIIPATITQEKEELLAMRQTVTEQTAILREAIELMITVAAFRSDMGLVIASIPAPIQQLALTDRSIADSHD